MPITRRHLLQLAAAATASAGPSPAITKIEVFPTPYPVGARFKFLPKPERPSVLVKITAEDGAVGWGQSVPVPTWSYETTESVTLTLRNYVAPVLIGRDPFDIAGAHTLMNRAISPSFSTGMPIAKAGIDLALHDLTARIRGQNVAERWGRKTPEKLTLSWTINPQTLDETAKLVEEGKRHGYKHFNVKVAPDPKFDIEMCRIVRKMAPDAFFWADANGGYDLATALAVAPKLADIGVDVLEQPIAANRLTGYREIRKQRALPILMDEGVVSSVELIEFIKLGLLDGVAMKPARTAGLWDARRQIEIVQDAGLLFLGSGLTDPDIALAAAIHLYGAYNLKFPAALNGPQFLTGSFLEKPLVVSDGDIEIPRGPGFGVQIDEKRIPAPF
ncbi:MAG: twin-arginine translocation signal domain-containing protein [Bryobacteraceae bacterium]|nr:twin-arginine translocation signal domain-containing protein [Bryobacteraceae bacterium]